MWNISNDVQILEYCKNHPEDPKCACYNPSPSDILDAKNRKQDIVCIRDCYPTYYIEGKKRVLCGDDCSITVKDTNINGSGILLLINKCFNAYNMFVDTIIMNDKSFMYRIINIIPFNPIFIIGIFVILSFNN